MAPSTWGFDLPRRFGAFEIADRAENFAGEMGDIGLLFWIDLKLPELIEHVLNAARWRGDGELLSLLFRHVTRVGVFQNLHSCADRYLLGRIQISKQ